MLKVVKEQEQSLDNNALVERGPLTAFQAINNIVGASNAPDADKALVQKAISMLIDDMRASRMELMLGGLIGGMQQH